MLNLSAITEQEISLISRLLLLLKAEQDILKDAKAAELPEICEKKSGLIDQLNTLEFERGKIIGAAKNENIGTAMDRWLASHPDERNTANNWKKLLGLAREAKQLHELNGQLVSQHLQQTNELLAALTRQPDKHTFYGSNGQASSATGSRIIDSA